MASNITTMVRTLIISAAILLGGTACQNTYHQEVTNPTPNAAPFTSKNHIYVALPEDGLDDKEPVASSGKRTALAIRDAFNRHTKYVTVATVPETLPDAIEHARNIAADHVVYPTILAWKDRHTEWTGIRDRLDLQIDVVDAGSGQTIRTSKIQGTSKWMSDGGEAPQDLLAEPVETFVRSLFRVNMRPLGLPK